jgi:hypothetical protein
MFNKTINSSSGQKAQAIHNHTPWYSIAKTSEESEEKKSDLDNKKYNITEITEELSKDSYSVSSVDIKLLKKNLGK